MPIINLRARYPHLPEDIFMEISDPSSRSTTCPAKAKTTTTADGGTIMRIFSGRWRRDRKQRRAVRTDPRRDPHAKDRKAAASRSLGTPAARAISQDLRPPHARRNHLRYRGSRGRFSKQRELFDQGWAEKHESV